MERECKHCKVVKPEKDFMTHKDHRTKCRDCHKAKVHEWRNKNVFKTRESQRNSFKKSAEFKTERYGNCHRIRTHYQNNENKINDNITYEETVSYDLHSIKVEQTTNISLAKEILDKYHYAGYGRAASKLFEVKLIDESVGIVKFCPPIRQNVAESSGFQRDKVLELDRFCIIPKYQVKNAASKIMSMVILELSKIESYDALISFADPFHGHRGTIYKASNWTEVGKSSKSYHYVDAGGHTINKKAVYNRAKNCGRSEKEYASELGLQKVGTPGKIKFIYDLRSKSRKREKSSEEKVRS